jgi:leucyl/phenylalanyl-tRNA---protein transferase
MPVFRLDDKELIFPPPYLAEPNGLLAIGGDLRPERLIAAYRSGIFPWFEEDGYFYWYTLHPRCVLLPEEIQVHKSMRSIFNQSKFRYTLDTHFEAVITACSDLPRDGQGGTWISPPFIQGYTALWRQGIAHSVEVWLGDALVGGLYGLALGKIFYGESMFSAVPNASKAGFITFVHALRKAGFMLIDCQQQTSHLLSLGARMIHRDLFMEYLERNMYEKTLQGHWSLDAERGIRLQ